MIGGFLSKFIQNFFLTTNTFLWFNFSLSSRIQTWNRLLSRGNSFLQTREMKVAKLAIEFDKTGEISRIRQFYFRCLSILLQFSVNFTGSLVFNCPIIRQKFTEKIFFCKIHFYFDQMRLEMLVQNRVTKTM